MLRKETKLWIVSLLCGTIVSCGAKLTPQESGAIGAVGATAVNKVINKTVKIAKYDLKLTIPNIEVCHKVQDEVFRCVYTNCIDCESYVSSIDLEDRVLISIKDWSDFLGRIKFYCKYNDCNLKENYKVLAEE